MSADVITPETIATEDPLNKASDIPEGLHPFIRTRWSPRAFADREVAAADLRLLLDAARWAASSYNEQPWRFLVATKSNPAAFQKILSTLIEFNQAWAKWAPVLMLTVAKKTFSHNGHPNLHAAHDVGLAMGNLITQATALDLYVHQMAGFDLEKARTLFQIPDDFEPVAAAAIGYLGRIEDLPAQYREREVARRQRKELNQIVFFDQWEHPLVW